MAYAQTVTGRIPAAALGTTLMHEHILCDLRDPETRDLPADWPPISPQNRFEIHYFQNRHQPNMLLDDDHVAEAELGAFAAAGGATIVELTVAGMRPQRARLARLAAASGVNIVCGAGHYVDATLTQAERDADIDAVADTIRAELATGAPADGIRCGLIGELGCSWPLTPPERRRLEAGARVQRETGAAITIHPGRHADAPAEIADVLTAAGADPARCIIGHMDRTQPGRDRLIALLRRGFLVEWDFFGIETSHNWLANADLDLPTDYMRLDILRDLTDAGYGASLAISHDICSCTRLMSFGGHGYAHIVRHVVPLMQRRGFSDSEVEQLLIATPARLLAYLSEPDAAATPASAP